MLESENRELDALRRRVAELEEANRKLAQALAAASPPVEVNPTTSKKTGVTISLKIDDGRVVTFDEDIIKIGRMKTATLCIPNNSLSRMHAVIERIDDTFTIVDLGSASGTWVNETQVNKATLERGDVIRLGAVSMTVL